MGEGVARLGLRRGSVGRTGLWKRGRGGHEGRGEGPAQAASSWPCRSQVCPPTMPDTLNSHKVIS